MPLRRVATPGGSTKRDGVHAILDDYWKVPDRTGLFDDALADVFAYNTNSIGSLLVKPPESGPRPNPGEGFRRMLGKHDSTHATEHKSNVRIPQCQQVVNMRNLYASLAEPSSHSTQPLQSPGITDGLQIKPDAVEIISFRLRGNWAIPRSCRDQTPAT
jgi:hypothetical protein